MLVSTHYHWDHVGGNEHLARKGTCIVGHASTWERMLEEWRVPEGQPTKYGAFPVVPPYPEIALPDATFEGRMRLAFDDRRIELIHFPAAHSGSDLAVSLPDANVVQTGDLYLSNGFPIIDSFHGGSLERLITALDSLIALVDDETIVVPGHGPPSDREGLRRYRTMLVTAGERIATLVREGKTLDEVVAADPTARLFPGHSWLPVEQFVWTVYADLTRGRGAGTGTLPSSRTP
jgi:glyoxylase-like metal-dependent hydrolase (beta-lactamase superfamily II)